MINVAEMGEEFRDDERRRVGLPPDVIKRLTRIDPVRAWLGVFETIGLIVVSIFLALYLYLLLKQILNWVYFLQEFLDVYYQ